jgi:hypothetical protein
LLLFAYVVWLRGLLQLQPVLLWELRELQRFLLAAAQVVALSGNMLPGHCAPPELRVLPAVPRVVSCLTVLLQPGFAVPSAPVLLPDVLQVQAAVVLRLAGELLFAVLPVYPTA